MMTSQTGSALVNARSVLERAGLRPGMRVADLGCGTTGHFIIPAARIVGTDGAAYAVDVQRSALAATEGRAKLEGIAHIAFVWSDLERAGVTAIPVGSLDFALLTGALHVVRDRGAVLREAVRLLRPGGALVVVEWKPGDAPIGPHAAQRVSLDEVRGEAQRAGLIERETFVVSAYHYGIVFTTS